MPLKVAWDNRVWNSSPIDGHLKEIEMKEMVLKRFFLKEFGCAWIRIWLVWTSVGTHAHTHTNVAPDISNCYFSTGQTLIRILFIFLLNSSQSEIWPSLIRSDWRRELLPQWLRGSTGSLIKLTTKTGFDSGHQTICWGRVRWTLPTALNYSMQTRKKKVLHVLHKKLQYE